MPVFFIIKPGNRSPIELLMKIATKADLASPARYKLIVDKCRLLFRQPAVAANRIVSCNSVTYLLAIILRNILTGLTGLSFFVTVISFCSGKLRRLNVIAYLACEVPKPLEEIFICRISVNTNVCFLTAIDRRT